MTSKIFRNSFLVGVAVFFLSIALFMGVLYQYFGSQLLIQLESEAALAARGVEMGSMDYLDGLSSANRITWIDAGGTVLFDNQADPAQMENHADREEVRAALESETGTASRYSTTLSQRTLYFAQRLADGTVLRVSSEQRSLPSLLLSMVQPILIILVLAVALSAVLAVKQQSHLPVVVDPSHACGKAWMVERMAMAAVAAGADGLIIEVHNDPKNALCDGAQSITPEQFQDVMDKLSPIAQAVGREI